MKLTELLFEGYDGDRGFWISTNPPKIVLNGDTGDYPHAQAIFTNPEDYGISQQYLSKFCPRNSDSYECWEKLDRIWGPLYMDMYSKGWLRGYVFEDFGSGEAGFSGFLADFITLWKQGLIQRVMGRYRSVVHMDLRYKGATFNPSFNYSHQNVNDFISEIIDTKNAA